MHSKQSLRRAQAQAMQLIMKGVNQINKGTTKARTAIARNSNAKKIKAKLDKLNLGRKHHRSHKQDPQHATIDDQVLFCVLNEREIFACLRSLLTEHTFETTSALMLNLLIENTSRSAVARNHDSYFSLLRDQLAHQKKQGTPDP